MQTDSTLTKNALFQEFNIQTTAKDMRIPALDFTKGALVVIMILYHWINYFIGPQWVYYRYLRFLTPSFIFITGFMISNVYLSKYDVADPSLMKRLFTRGLKLIAIFIVLNVVRGGLLPILSPGSLVPSLLHPRNLMASFVTGDFNGKVVAFYVLVPIAYLLILSGTLMVPFRSFKYIFNVVCVCLFAAISILYLSGTKSQLLEMLAIGILGIVVGFSPIAALNKAIGRPSMILFAYVLYVIAIAVWNVPYPLEIMGTCLSVTIIYLVGTVSSRPNRIREGVLLLGKYSLLGYISQIAILQILAASVRHLSFRSAAVVISFPAAFALVVIAVEVVHRARLRAISIDRLYRLVFN